MQQREVCSIQGCSKGKFLLSMDVGKVISAIHGCIVILFLLSWMQQREVSAIYECRTGKFLLSKDAAKDCFDASLIDSRSKCKYYLKQYCSYDSHIYENIKNTFYVDYNVPKILQNYKPAILSRIDFIQRSHICTHIIRTP